MVTCFLSASKSKGRVFCVVFAYPVGSPRSLRFLQRENSQMKCFFFFLGRRDKDWIQSLESIPLQAGGSYFGRSGPDPYQAWSKGHVPGSCLRHHSVSCFWHSWTSEYIPPLICLALYKNSLFFCQIYTDTVVLKCFSLCLHFIWWPMHKWRCMCFVVSESVLCSYRYQTEEFQRSPDCLVSQEGLVYAVEFSHRSGRDLLNVAKKRTNIIPIIEDARHPHKYRMLVGESPSSIQTRKHELHISASFLRECR